ncbi:DUF4860 domain-containing protein [Parablautia muri]|uniref:DUF4860 domain-containing protein n=1 Tax=Parablautia muri TaxID=2320879 RepID=A0A9X5BFF0_9FIRM|nr:DUF4860 domain-containing protein [Parablautia muri]NBJ93046.1 DUF4860 domain-containing protein [Parablautia muri]
MKKRTMEYHLDGLIALLLFGVFAACLMAVLFTGANAYRRLTFRNNVFYENRTCAQYVAVKVRQVQDAHAIEIEDFGEGDALVFPDGNYVTRVYYYDGYLMELYSEKNSALGPQAGEKVMEAGGLSFSLEDGMLFITITDQEGETEELMLSLYGEGEVAV